MALDLSQSRFGEYRFVFKAAPICENEVARLEALREYDILDTPPEDSFDNITRIARMILGTSMASISLIDADRQWLKSRQNMSAKDTPRAITFCAHAVASASPLVVCDTHEDDRFRDNPLVKGPPHLRFYAGMPLITSANIALGTLCVLDTVPRATVSADHLEMLYALSRMTVDAIELRRLAVLDSLTDVLTRGAFRHAARREFERAAAVGRPLSCVLIDIDHFKAINDTHGHAVGDMVLRSVAAKLRAETRVGDLVGRIGGEEFALLMPDTPIEIAMRCADRVRATLATTSIDAGARRIPLTASFGVATCSLEDASCDDVMARADQALYASKNGGRNRVSYIKAPTQIITAA